AVHRFLAQRWQKRSSRQRHRSRHRAKSGRRQETVSTSDPDQRGGAQRRTAGALCDAKKRIRHCLSADACAASRLRCLCRGVRAKGPKTEAPLLWTIRRQDARRARRYLCTGVGKVPRPIQADAYDGESDRLRNSTRLGPPKEKAYRKDRKTKSDRAE